MSRITNDEFQRMLQKFRDDGRDIYTDDMYINSKTPLDFYYSKGHHVILCTNTLDVLIAGIEKF